MRTNSKILLIKSATLVIWFLVGVVVTYFTMLMLNNQSVNSFELNLAKGQAPVVAEAELVALLDRGNAVKGKPVATKVATDLKLLGVIVSSMTSKADKYDIALIQVNSAQPLPYRKGDLVADKYLLQSLAKNAVYLVEKDVKDSAGAKEPAPIEVTLAEDQEVKKLVAKMRAKDQPPSKANKPVEPAKEH